MNIDQETKRISEELDDTMRKIGQEKMTFEALRQNAKSIQVNTKRLRNLWQNCSASEKRDSAFRKAIESIAKVADAFKERSAQMEKGSLAERDLASEIGDYCGIQGGTYRDWGKFDEAAKAYGEGDRFAKRVKELGGKSNSYCLVQELINSVLADPAILLSRDGHERKLRPALNQIRQADRTGDAWAQADQALVTQLVDPQRANEEWDTLDDLQPKPEVYAATKNVVVALLERLRPQLDPAALQSWDDVIKRLQ